jgi:hypothetical protein
MKAVLGLAQLLASVVQFASVLASAAPNCGSSGPTSSHTSTQDVMPGPSLAPKAAAPEARLPLLYRVQLPNLTAAAMMSP